MGGGPGGVERGRISIRVLPNPKGFGVSLERYLQRMENRLVLTLPVRLDPKGVARDAENIHKATEKLVGSVQVPVRVDREALDQLRGLGRQVKVDVDTSSTRRASRDVQRVSTEVSRLAQRIRDLRTVWSATVRPLTQFATGTARAAVVAGGLSAALLGATGLVGGLTAFAASAAAAAGAAPLILPGLAALGAIAGTVKVALSGVGDALAEAIGDDAFADISPQADRFVASVKAIVPALVTVRNAVQDAFFAKLGDQVAPLAQRFLPEFRRQAVGIAEVLNGALRRGLQSVNNSTDQWRLGTILASARKSLTSFAPLVERLPRLLLKVGEAAAPAFGRLADRLSGALTRVFDRLESSAGSGGIGKAIDAAVDVAADLGATLLAVFRTLRGIGQAASDAFGTNLTSPLRAAAEAMERFVTSVPGRDLLTNLFASARPVLRDLGDLLGDVAGSIGRLLPVAAGLASAFLQGLQPVVPVAERLAGALGGALTSILPALSDVAVVVGETLASALEALAPSLPVIAGGLAAMAQAVGGGLQAFFTALAPILPKLAESFALLAISLGEGLAASLIKITPRLPDLVDAFVALAGVLTEYTPAVVDALAEAFVAMAPELPGIAKSLGDIAIALASLTPAAVAILNGVAAGIGDVAAALSGDTSSKLSTFAAALLAVQAPTAADPSGSGLSRQGKFIADIGVALSRTNPELITFSGVTAALFGALSRFDFTGIATQISTQFLPAFQSLPGKVRTALTGLGPAVVQALGGLPGLARGAVGPLPGMVMGVLTGLSPRARALWAGVLQGARAALSGLPATAAAAVAGTPGAVVRAIIGVVAATGRVGTDTVASIGRTLARAPGAAAAAMAGLGPAVVGALSGVAGQAFSAGANIVSSIASGIISRIGSVVGAIGRVAGAIKDHLPNSPVKTGPLRVLNSAATNPGGQIVKMVAAGMLAELDAVRSASERAAGIVAAGLGPDGAGTGLDRAIARVAAYSAPSQSSAQAGPVVAGGVTINGPVTTTDIDELGRELRRRQADALAVYSIAALAAAGTG